MPARNGTRPPRTLLAQRITEMRLSIEEFAEYAERYARDHNERGTLSVRHLQRLMAGRRSDGRPLGKVNPATARLLESIFGDKLEFLLAPPVDLGLNTDTSVELSQRLATSRRVDHEIVALLHQQLDHLRRLDGQLGAVATRKELLAKIDQVSGLLTHCLDCQTRRALAALLAEMETLAGWQDLDLCNTTASWQHYERAKFAAHESGDPAYEAHAQAEQAYVLLDSGRIADANSAIEAACGKAGKTAPAELQAWLVAARGETLTASGDVSAGQRCFDRAEALLPETRSEVRPHVVLDSVHLDRWRGHALAVAGQVQAIDLIRQTLRRHDPTFTRAGVALQIDLATILFKDRRHEEAQTYARSAAVIASELGSARLYRRALTSVELRPLTQSHS